jgi:hypothetical protein
LLAGGALAILFALSFVATPVKFLASEVPLTHLLAVGRVTFRASLVVESVLLIILIAVTRANLRWLIFAAATTLTAQWLALMPRLEERTLARMAGLAVEPSSLHQWWIAFDVFRIVIYAVIVRRSLQGFTASGAAPTSPEAAWIAGESRLRADDGNGRSQ